MTVVELEIEELHIDTSKRPQIAHMFCRHCHPVMGPGAKAFCGIVKKTKANPDAINWEKCVVCVSFRGKPCPVCGTGCR